MNKKLIVSVIFFFFLSGCANLDTYLQQNNYQKAKEEALYMEDSDINERLDNGSTYLIETIKYNKPELESILIKRKADIYKTDKKGFSPLYYAINSQNIKLINPILKRLFKYKKEAYIKKEIQKHPTLKPLFLKELPKLIDINSSYYKILLLSNLFSSQKQTQIFSTIKNKKKLINIIPNKDNKLLTLILNYSLKTKNYKLLNLLSKKTFIYNINYSMPKVTNSIKYVGKIYKKRNREWGYIANLIYAPTLGKSIFKNFSNSLNEGVRKYLTPNNILIGKYNIPTSSYRLNIIKYKKNKNYFIFGFNIKKISPIGFEGWWRRIELKYPIINEAKPFDIVKIVTLDGKVVYTRYKYSKHQPKITPGGKIIPKYKGIIYKKLPSTIDLWDKAYFYYDKFFSLAQISTFKATIDEWTSLLPPFEKIFPARSLLLPRFVTNIKRGKFESTWEFKKRKEKINKANEKMLNKFIIKLNKRIKNYKNAKILFNSKNIKKVVDKIKNKTLETIFKHKLLSYHYDADKEIYTIKIKIWAPFNIGKSFEVNGHSTPLYLRKIKCLGGYGNSMKLNFDLYDDSYYFFDDYKGNEVIPLTICDNKYCSDLKLHTNDYEGSYIYYGSKSKNIFFYTSNSKRSSFIKNPCIDTKVLTLKLPMKRTLAIKAKKILSKKHFQPTLIFIIKNNTLKLIGIKELNKFVTGGNK